MVIKMDDGAVERPELPLNNSNDQVDVVGLSNGGDAFNRWARDFN